jgi:hypothetical protein
MNSANVVKTSSISYPVLNSDFRLITVTYFATIHFGYNDVVCLNNPVLFELFTCKQCGLFELCLNYAIQLNRDSP